MFNNDICLGGSFFLDCSGKQIDEYGKKYKLTIVCHEDCKNDYRIFKTGSLLSENEYYPSGLVTVGKKLKERKYNGSVNKKNEESNKYKKEIENKKRCPRCYSKNNGFDYINTFPLKFIKKHRYLVDYKDSFFYYKEVAGRFYCSLCNYNEKTEKDKIIRIK